MFKKGDIILIAVLVAMVFASFYGVKQYKSKGANMGLIAVIKQDNKIIKTIDLNTITRPQRIQISGKYSEVVLVEKGRIRFEEADCPDKLCVKTGWLTSFGDMAACIPNHTSIRIQGKAKVDGVAY